MITTNYSDGDGGLGELVGARLYSRLCGAVRDKRFYVDMFEVPDYRMRGFVK
jgi:hypothetical protein